MRDQRSSHDDLERLVALDKAPRRNRAVGAAQAQAGVFPQVRDAFRLRARAQIIRAADHHQRERRHQPHGHHIGRDELAETDTGVEAFGRDVHRLLGRGDLQLDFGIGLVERGEYRLQQQRDDGSGNGDAQKPRRTLPQVACDFARGDQLLEGGLCPRQESRAGFGQPDTARGAGEDAAPMRFPACATAWLIADGVTPSCAAALRKLRSLSNAQERLDAVQRALPDCELRPHSLIILSRKVARRKRPYVCGEAMELRGVLQ